MFLKNKFVIALLFGLACLGVFKTFGSLQLPRAESVVNWAYPEPSLDPKKIVKDQGGSPIDLEISKFLSGRAYTYKTHVSECSQWLELMNFGYQPADAFNISKMSYFIDQCGPLALNSSAAEPKTSYVRDFKFSSDTLTQVSPLLSGLHLSGDSYLLAAEAERSGISWSEFDQSVSIESVSDNELVIVYSSGEKEMFVIKGWADFDKDGLEDIAIFRASYSTGSFRSFDYILLSRENPNSVISVKNFDLFK